MVSQVEVFGATCGASGRLGVHAHQERQDICQAWKRTCAETTTGTLWYGLTYPVQWADARSFSVLLGGAGNDGDRTGHILAALVTVKVAIVGVGAGLIECMLEASARLQHLGLE